MYQISKFDYNISNRDTTTLTVLTDNEDGSLWFIGGEAAGMLEYTNPSRSINAHCKHVKILKTTDLVGLDINPRGIQIIPESDLYRLIIKSTLPSAEIFEKWVFEEVIPSIRKSGSYSPIDCPDMSDPLVVTKLLIETGEKYIVSETARRLLLIENKKQAQLITEQSSDVKALDVLTKRDLTTYSITKAGKQLLIPMKKFFFLLKRDGYLTMDKTASQQSINAGYIIMKKQLCNDNVSRVRAVMTPKGITAMTKRYCDPNSLPEAPDAFKRALTIDEVKSVFGTKKHFIDLMMKHECLVRGKEIGLEYIPSQSANPRAFEMFDSMHLGYRYPEVRFGSEFIRFVIDHSGKKISKWSESVMIEKLDNIITIKEESLLTNEK